MRDERRVDAAISESQPGDRSDRLVQVHDVVAALELPPQRDERRDLVGDVCHRAVGREADACARAVRGSRAARAADGARATMQAQRQAIVRIHRRSTRTSWPAARYCRPAPRCGASLPLGTSTNTEIQRDPHLLHACPPTPGPTRRRECSVDVAGQMGRPPSRALPARLWRDIHWNNHICASLPGVRAGRMTPMRIALVSPYSWTYPGTHARYRGAGRAVPGCGS